MEFNSAFNARGIDDPKSKGYLPTEREKQAMRLETSLMEHMKICNSIKFRTSVTILLPSRGK